MGAAGFVSFSEHAHKSRVNGRLIAVLEEIRRNSLGFAFGVEMDVTEKNGKTGKR